MNCRKCNFVSVKNGKQSNGKQRYYCKNCKSSFQQGYHYNAYRQYTDKFIYNYLTEGVGIRATSRLLKISKTTVLKRIKQMASKITEPMFQEKNQYYELDEMRVVVGCKKNEAWLTYAINRHTKQIINFIIGRRTKDNLSYITKSVLNLTPKMIFTDRLRTYMSLIPQHIHDTKKKTPL